MGLNILEKKTCVQVSVFRDLITNVEPIPAETVVFHSNRSQGHYIKGSQHLSKHTITEIVYITKVQSQTASKRSQ